MRKLLSFWELGRSFHIGNSETTFLLGTGKILSFSHIGNWAAPFVLGTGKSLPIGHREAPFQPGIISYRELGSSFRFGNYKAPFVMGTRTILSDQKMGKSFPIFASKCQRHMSVINGSVADV